MKTFRPFFLTAGRQKYEPQNRVGRRAFAAMAVFMIFLVFQTVPEKAWGQILPLPLPTVPPISSSSPQQNLSTDSKVSASLSSQLLNLLARGSAGLQGTASSEFIFAVLAPLTYNTNPGLASGSSVPAWEFDPQVEILHSAPLGENLLLTEIVSGDTAIYPDNSGFNLDTLSGQFQINFTDEGLHFDNSPFVAYKTSYTFPASSPGHAWVNDVALGFNFNRVLGTGSDDSDSTHKDSQADPLEIDFNPSLSQRWVEVNDGAGNSSTTGSSALEMEIPFIYKFTPRLNLIFDLTAYTRYYNVHQAPGNEDRVDEAFSFPLSIGWTMVPAWNLKLQVLGGYTQQFSSVSDQNIVQLDTGVNLLLIF